VLSLAVFLFMQPFTENSYRTPDTGIDRDGIDRAVEGAGPTLHAGIPICHRGLLAVNNEDMMRTNLHAPPATYTGWLVEYQGDNILQVMKSVHCRLNTR
jgi:hypothetical protein